MRINSFSKLTAFLLLWALTFACLGFAGSAFADEPEHNRAYSIDELYTQDLGPDDCPDRPEGRHYWDGHITVIPSLTDEGEYTYTCRSCGKEIKLRMQPAVSEYQIAAWQRSNPQAVMAEPDETDEQPAPAGELLHQGSGCQAVSKLSQGQIRQLLSAAPQFDFTPEEIASHKIAWQSVVARLNAMRQIASLPEAAASSELAAQLTPTVDELLADYLDGNVQSLPHRRWLLDPYLEREAESGAAYDYIAWPASGNFPSDIFSADTPWSVTLNPDKFQTPDIFATNVNIVRSMDGAKWHFGGANGDNYRVADSGKYYNVDTNDYGVSNCIIFRPDGISEYQGSYTVTISGLRYLDGREVTLTYEVEFFKLGQLDAPAKPELASPDAPAPETVPADWAVPFTDVQSGDYFAQPVAWAVAQGVTKGASPTSFEPDATCNKAQIITFLWRAYGSPQSGIPNPFRDVQKSDYYYDAVLWAAEHGVVSGNRFDGDAPCTRAMTVNYLWLAANSPTPAQTADFVDVPAATPYNLAVAWAVEQNITTGASATTFEPQQTCTRGQIVTFLYRALADNN